eukprot:CAMPEP_0194178878 /NCGR_PEP_ID=MMETSP0154-20130528/12416_1 /TAXON_ID=1049557 /ORGANISM="Thalassiothrix antarctica, Strain L6-D1" /LENGTH=223 /DNA_ID=CAMNT_0038894009 /DNA_START=30 /DNA_END=701 /DNA_ORIENTATION=-
MVLYFTSRCGNYMIYMGRDKYENEDLIKYGHPEDVWFHVDDLSSAHVYLRQKKGEKLEDINDDLLLDCSSLVKANSIAGCKKTSVYVVYTRWKNLKKTKDMVEGQVSFHRPKNVRRIETEKNKPTVNELNRTKREEFPDLYQQQQERERESIEEKKLVRKEQIVEDRAKEKQRKMRVLDAKKEDEQRKLDIQETVERTRRMNMESDDDSSVSSEGSDDGLLGF